MKKIKRVLIFYIQPKSGHFSAAKAIETAFKRNHPDVYVKTLDFMRYVNPVIAQLLLKTYINVIKRSPDTWDYLYDNPKVFEKTKKLRNLIIKINLTRIRKIITKIKPNIILCTQAIPCNALAYYKEQKPINFKLISVITDFSTHSYWLNDKVNYYIIPSEREKWRLMSKNIDKEKIKVLGIPLDAKFNKTLSKEKLKHKFKLDLNLPTILIMGGTQGLGKIKQIVNKITKIHIPFQLLIVAGTNKRLLKKITNKLNKGEYLKNIKIFSHINYVDELMEISDLIITKPGGITSAEALAKNTPMLIINPIPGQESKNCDYLTGEKAAVTANNEDELIEILTELLQNPEQLNELSFQTQRIKKPTSSEDIAKFAAEL
jgi:processive 1,2-diacylglycerol beta-glucosyltransferase